MVGTIFLFIYWPSFNGILGVGLAKHRAIVNTTLSIASSVLSSVFISRILTGAIDMEVLLNATLAGGVIMGSACDLITNPGYAMMAGCTAGIVSALGFMRLNSWCNDKLKLHDTCGVHFLHGIPGTLGALTSVIAVACATNAFANDTQLEHIYGQYPNRSMNN